MNWKVKGLGQSVLSALPRANVLNYWGQKYITRAHSNYPERQWRWFNSRLHYQNRLRHSNPAECFAIAGSKSFWKS